MSLRQGQGKRGQDGAFSVTPGRREPLACDGECGEDIVARACLGIERALLMRWWMLVNQRLRSLARVAEQAGGGGTEAAEGMR